MSALSFDSVAWDSAASSGPLAVSEVCCGLIVEPFFVGWNHCGERMGSAVGPSGVALGQVASTVLGIEDGMELAEAALRLERILTGVGVEHPGHLVGAVLEIGRASCREGAGSSVASLSVHGGC